MRKPNFVAVIVLVAAGCADSGEQQTTPAADTSTATAAAAQPAPTSAGGMLDPNTATVEELAAIPGLDQAAATALVNGRPYQDMRAVDRLLANLTQQQRDTVYTRLWKPLDLNSATKEEIELIPGVGPKMRHEFEEYRPYTSIEQFRREIGKYVDEQEVARLEKYVTIKNAQQ
jgi:DNA uptake protein ComE-like DNA-binding protein